MILQSKEHYAGWTILTRVEKFQVAHQPLRYLGTAVMQRDRQTHSNSPGANTHTTMLDGHLFDAGRDAHDAVLAEARRCIDGFNH